VETGPAVTGFEPGDRVAVAPALSCDARGIDPVCRPCGRGMFAACENTAVGSLVPGMFTGINSQTGGGFGPYFVAHQSQLFKMPPDLAPEIGALIEPLSVGLQAVTNNPPAPGDRVLVVGGGVIGQMIVRAIRALDFDCRVTVSEPAPFAAERVKAAGADEVAGGGDLYGLTAGVTGAKRYKPMMGPELLMGGFDRIYDAVGNSATINAAMRCLAGQGILSVVGIGAKVNLDLTPLWLKMQTIKGVFGCSFTDFRGEKRHMFDIALTLAAEGRVDLTGMVTHKFKLEEYDKLIEANLAKERNRVVKAVVEY
jgi:threonine dehydrogenase-like Zn-dependent dehydrogenase